MGTHRKRRRVVHLSVTERVIIVLALVAVGALVWDVHRRWAAGPGVGGLATDVYEAGRPHRAATAVRRPPPAPSAVAVRATPQPPPAADSPYVRHPTTYTRAVVASPRARVSSPLAAPPPAPPPAPASGAPEGVRFPSWSDAEP